MDARDEQDTCIEFEVSITPEQPTSNKRRQRHTTLPTTTQHPVHPVHPCRFTEQTDSSRPSSPSTIHMDARDKQDTCIEFEVSITPEQPTSKKQSQRHATLPTTTQHPLHPVHPCRFTKQTDSSQPSSPPTIHMDARDEQDICIEFEVSITPEQPTSKKTKPTARDPTNHNPTSVHPCEFLTP